MIFLAPVHARAYARRVFLVAALGVAGGLLPARGNDFFLRAAEADGAAVPVLRAEDHAAYRMDGRPPALWRDGLAPTGASPADRELADRSDVRIPVVTFSDANWPPRVSRAFRLASEAPSVPTREAGEAYWLRADTDFVLTDDLRLTFGAEAVSGFAQVDSGYDLDVVFGTDVSVFETGRVELVVGVGGALDADRDEATGEQDIDAGVGLYQELAWRVTDAFALRGNLAGYVFPEGASTGVSVDAGVEGTLYDALVFGVLYRFERDPVRSSDTVREDNRVTTRLGYRF